MLNLEHREVTAMGGDLYHYPGQGGQGELVGGKDHFQRAAKYRHSTIGTQWQPQSIDSKIVKLEISP